MLSRIPLSYIIGSLLLLAWAMSSCSSPKDYLYLEDIQPFVTINTQDPRPIKLQTGDRLNIMVHSRDRELVEMFNISSYGMSNNSGAGRVTGASYTVDENGKIEMPIIGAVHVRGLSRMEVQNMIRYKLLASKLVRDPIVMVQFSNIAYFTLGEGTNSRHEITVDNLTLLEAIAETGGLRPGGRRDNVMVLRRTDGQQTPYLVNLTKTADVYSSPVYYIQQNDIIYVQPTDRAIDEAISPTGAAYRNPMFWVGIFNTALSMILLFTNF